VKVAKNSISLYIVYHIVTRDKIRNVTKDYKALFPSLLRTKVRTKVRAEGGKASLCSPFGYTEGGKAYKAYKALYKLCRPKAAKFTKLTKLCTSFANRRWQTPYKARTKQSFVSFVWLANA
jgi:hypothetical protein